jgi:hypothetical protein
MDMLYLPIMIVDLIYIVLYCMSVILAYIFFRSAWLENYKDWTSSDRNFFFGCSLAGPLSLAIAGFNYWVVKTQ